MGQVLFFLNIHFRDEKAELREGEHTAHDTQLTTED